MWSLLFSPKQLAHEDRGGQNCREEPPRIFHLQCVSSSGLWVNFWLFQCRKGQTTSHDLSEKMSSTKTKRFVVKCWSEHDGEESKDCHMTFAQNGRACGQKTELPSNVRPQHKHTVCAKVASFAVKNMTQMRGSWNVVCTMGWDEKCCSQFSSRDSWWTSDLRRFMKARVTVDDGQIRSHVAHVRKTISGRSAPN